MLNEQEIKELLKRMSENDKNILIELINKERTTKANNEDLLKLPNNLNALTAEATKSTKMELQHINILNLYVEIVKRHIQ